MVQQVSTNGWDSSYIFVLSTRRVSGRALFHRNNIETIRFGTSHEISKKKWLQLKKRMRCIVAPFENYKEKNEIPEYLRLLGHNINH